MVLKIIDILGPAITLNINKYKQMKTETGGILTIILIYLFLMLFISFGIDFIDKKKPIVTLNKINNNFVPNNTIESDSFIFTIYEQREEKEFPDIDKRFNFYYELLEYDSNNSTKKNKTFIPFEICEDIVKDKWKAFIKRKISFYCFPKDTKIEIMGKANCKKASAIRIQVDYCTNNTDPNKGLVRNDCKSIDETKSILSNKIIQMNYLLKNVIVNTNNYGNPFTEYLITGTINTNANSWSRMIIKNKLIRIQSDIGFISNNYFIEDEYGIFSISNESLFSLGTSTIFSHLIVNSESMDFYERHYVKLQDILALTLGFFNFTFMAFKFFMTLVTKTNMNNIFNKIYCYENLESNTYKFDLTNSISLNDIINLKEIKITNNISKNKYIIKHKFLGNFTCLLNKKTKFLYDKINTKMNKVMSFENIIKITKSNKIMKYILFEDYQRKIFNICSSPKKHKIISNKMILKNFLKEAKDNETDRKLYNLIEKI